MCDAKFWAGKAGYAVKPTVCHNALLKPYHPKPPYSKNKYKVAITQIGKQDAFRLRLDKSSGWGGSAKKINKLRFKPKDETYKSLIARPRTPPVFEGLVLESWEITYETDETGTLYFLDTLTWKNNNLDKEGELKTSWRWINDN